jgi:DNA repair exonuclease SbcCD ATPase subunit
MSMDKDSKYRPVLDKVQSQIMKAEIGVTGVYQVMLEALDEAETAEAALREELSKEREALSSAQKVMDVYEKQKRALREELAALRAENAKLNSVVCQTCHGAGSVCSAPDDCYNCPECVATENKVRADAIRSVTEQGFEYSVEHGPWDNDWVISQYVINDYANQVEAGL